MGFLLYYLQVVVPIAILAHKLPRKSHFALRAGCSLVGAFLICRMTSLITATIPVLREFSTSTHINFASFVLLAISMVSVWLCFDCMPKVAMFCGSGGFAIQNCVYYLKRIIMMLFSIDHYRYDGIMSLVIFSAAYVMFFCFEHWLIDQEYKGDVENSLAIIFPVSVVLINIVMSASIPWSDDTMLYCLYAFLLSLSLIVIQMGAFNLASSKVEKRLLEQMVTTEQRQHTVYEETIHMINMKCHDIKQEISVLLKDENIRKEEVERIQNLVNVYGAFVKTGNPTLDVVLSEKKVICEKNGILFTCMVDGKLLDFMETVDICILLGNALDNAIESAQKEPDMEKRFIDMTVAVHGEFVSIHIENSCCTELQYHQGELVSDKANEAGYHGFGTRSMRMVTEKYCGNITMQKIEDIFYLDILLPKPASDAV